MKHLALLALAAVLAAGAAHAEYLLYGYDDEGFDGWYMRVNEGSVPPEGPLVLGTDAPAQGAGYASLTIESNRYYTLIRAPEGFESTVAWETYDTIAFDVRLSNPQGWNSFVLLCRSDTNWSYAVAQGQIYAYQSNLWVTLRGPITSQLTNYLYSAQWRFFEFAINQAEISTTRVEIDNFRLERDSDRLLEGVEVYGFDTNTMDGWASYRRGVAAWDTNNPALGVGCMQVTVTGAVGNWANCAQKTGALGDGPWELNSNIMVWIRADAGTSNNFAPQLLVNFGPTNVRIYASESGGHVARDGVWHPYTYPYNPALADAATMLTLTWDVTCDGSPIDNTFFIDNIRLLPGIVPEPAVAVVLALGSLIGLRRRR